MLRKFLALVLCLMMAVSSVALADVPDVSEFDYEEQLALLDELLAALDDSAINTALTNRIADFGDDTLAALSDLIAAEIESRNIPTLQNGSKGEEVRALQERLIELGYLSGNADGSFGNKTAEAVRSFQEAANLDQTGIADAETQIALFAEDAPEAEPAPEATPAANEEKESPAQTGIRPEIKEALDSYEDFFDEYCEFMEKYSDSNNSITMLGDYLSFLAKYTETMTKLEALEDDLNDAELGYYMQVMGRITQKLAQVAY